MLKREAVYIHRIEVFYGLVMEIILGCRTIF